MTETIRCADCDMLLYFGEEIKRRLYMRAIPSEQTVLGYYHDVCPRCGAKLTLETVQITLKGRDRHVPR
jgi:phage FluMu protein Com